LLPYSPYPAAPKNLILLPHTRILPLYKADTAHYIRVQKAFLDNTKSAITMAKTPDSSFYSNLSVRIKRYSIITGLIHDTILLSRVDLTSEGYPKQPGLFFQAPNYAYKFTDSLDPAYFYRIVVTNNATGEIDSADAPIIKDTDPTTFHIDQLDDATTHNGGMSFYNTAPHHYFEISGYYVKPFTYKFHDQTSPVAIAQGVIRFHWADSSNITHALTLHYYDYNLGYTQTQGGSFVYDAEDINLYSALSSGMGPTPDASIYRLIDRAELFIYLSTPDFYTYQQAIANQGVGLTGNEIEPTYTNIQGANVYGLYTSRAVRSDYITITPQTVDSLIAQSKAGSLLGNSQLVGTRYH
jgi:hypothetical protein